MIKPCNSGQLASFAFCKRRTGLHCCKTLPVPGDGFSLFLVVRAGRSSPHAGEAVSSCSRPFRGLVVRFWWRNVGAGIGNEAVSIGHFDARQRAFVQRRIFVENSVEV